MDGRRVDVSMLGIGVSTIDLVVLVVDVRIFVHSFLQSCFI